MKACLVNQSSFFYFCFVWLPSGAFTLTQDESQYYGKSTKVIFLERELSQFKNFLENLKHLVMLYFRIRIDFRYCDFYMLILGLCESESESQSESESGDILVVFQSQDHHEGLNSIKTSFLLSNHLSYHYNLLSWNEDNPPQNILQQTTKVGNVDLKTEKNWTLINFPLPPIAMLIPVISTINLWSCYAAGITTDYINWKNQHCKWGEGDLLQIFCGGLKVVVSIIFVCFSPKSLSRPWKWKPAKMVSLKVREDRHKQ